MPGGRGAGGGAGGVTTFGETNAPSGRRGGVGLDVGAGAGGAGGSAGVPARGRESGPDVPEAGLLGGLLVMRRRASPASSRCGSSRAAPSTSADSHYPRRVAGIYGGA